MPIYVTLMELKPRRGCEVDPDEFAGAITRGYAAAETLKAAIERFETAASDLKFDMVDMEWCGNAEVIDLEDRENPNAPNGRQLANDAKTSGQVVFGEFQVWEHGEDAGEGGAADAETTG